MANYFFHLIFGALITLILWVLRLISSTRSGAKTAAWVLRLIPSFAFAFGILNMSNITLYAAVEGYTVHKDVYDLDIAGADILMLAMDGFLYLFLIFIVEKLEDNGSI